MSDSAKIITDPFSSYMPQVSDYLRQVHPAIPGASSWKDITITPLAAGEYNINFLLSGACTPAVFRINIASQIKREDQILYEYKALELLFSSGVTPIPYHVDDAREYIDRGILIMEYLEGAPLDYTRDMEAAARVFAAIHSRRPAAEDIHLIPEEHPLDMIYRECEGLLATYFTSPLAAPEISDQLQTILAWAGANRHKEQYYLDDPWFCIVNTEVNSGNFIVNRRHGTTHLIDWEMPRWGDPSSDLCHFISPLTTLWKTDYRIDEETTRLFLKRYAQSIEDKHLINTLKDRMELKMGYVLLRGISWSAMAWIAYQGEYSGVRNQDTWRTLNRYMDGDFIKSLFAPYVRWA